MTSQNKKSPREMADDEFVKVLGALLPKPPVSGGGK
jgi:hypothetical protein